MSESRAAVLHCPYCAAEDLFPLQQHGGWECRSCLRAFSVRLLGLTVRTDGSSR